MQEFKDKVAVITGAGRGIGRGIALQCAREGMKVVLAGFSMESLVKTEAELKSMGTETLIVQTDVSVLEQVENLAEKSFEAFGRVDLLVNNAGVAVPVSVLDSTMDDWNWVMGVNFNGVLYGVRTFIPRMMAQSTPGHIVNVSSISGLTPGGGHYGVSKHAVVVLTESLYEELANKHANIKVSVYCPGWVSTEFDQVDRSRPERFSANATLPSEEIRPGWRKALEGGVSTEESAQYVFEGIRNNKLYIGLKAFQPHQPEIVSLLQDRTRNMLEEINPNIPDSLID